jgi:hypothetical protein
MQKRITLMIAGCAALAAITVMGASTPASAVTAATPAAVHYGDADASLVQEVGRRWRKGWRGHYGYYRPYRHYGYYRPYYGYYRPYYYRPYAYYGGYGWPYYRRPGISLWFGF